MRSVLAEVRTVAPTSATVLLTGETGVGKGVIARLIHQWSNRTGEPFVSVHCGAIPEGLIESELFGHEKGSFTGAYRRQKGKFELAHGGSLFLDEIGSISSAAQIKLLDVLQGQRFHRVGGEQEVAVDVRIVAATNSDLDARQRQGSFRSDLFYRLSVFPIEIPSLRQRKEDLPLLVEQMLAHFSRRYRKRIEGLDPVVEQALHSYDWPGNIRELENLLERACIIETKSVISPSSVPRDILEAAGTHVFVPIVSEPSDSLAAVRDAAIAAAERRYLGKLLGAHRGRIDESARAAGITTRQLSKLLSKHEIDKANFKLRRRSGDKAPGSASSG